MHTDINSPANTIHRNNVVLLLAQGLRRRPNIKTTLFQCVLFAEWEGRYLPVNTIRSPCPVLVLAQRLRRAPNTNPITRETQTFVQCLSNVEDVGPMLYKWYANVLR